MLPYDRKLKARSQELRKNATLQENKLWYEFLRRNHCPFTRQKPIGEYIVDFFCSSKKLVIEIDGNQHYTPERLEYDRLRTNFLESLGLHVLRFKNTEIDFLFPGVCTKIQNYLDTH